MQTFLYNLLNLSLEAAPWLVLGLVIGGLIKALVPVSFLHKHLSGSGIVSITKAALFGAPLPLCSCGVVPAALGLRRAGASKPATISFLVSTPETGVDSMTVSYALLGPFMTVVRPVAAIISAITAGLLVGKSESSNGKNIENINKQVEGSCCDSGKSSSESSCCNSVLEGKEKRNQGRLSEAWQGIVYSFETLFGDILLWLLVGLIFAALVKTFVPITFLAEWGSGLPAMLVMLLVGIPMYVCATASTPIAAGLLLAGISPGTAMVFLMAGPATNISTLGIIGKELGRRALMAYLMGVSVVAVLTGLVVDTLVELWGVDVQTQISHSEGMVPQFIAIASLLILIAVVVKLKISKTRGGVL